MDEIFSIKVLFVCTGNICRSPMAEGTLRHILKAHNLSHVVFVDSAGSQGYHVGDSPHPKAISAIRSRGIDISQLRSRQLTQKDIGNFDWIVALDRANQRYAQSLVENSSPKKILLLMDFTENWAEKDVPDPLLTNVRFDVVMEMIEDACYDLVYDLENELRLTKI